MARQRLVCVWAGPSGYFDYVTDLRQPAYVRLYVGQCRKGIRRLLRQHAQNILQNSIESLHYYLLWVSNG
jgi:hypothetical protein